MPGRPPRPDERCCESTGGPRDDGTSHVARQTRDLTRETFGRWVAIDRAPNRGGRAYWRCRCECGAERDVLAASLVGGRSTSCGCWASLVEVGDRYGRLVVVGPATRNKHGQGRSLCRCDCGTEVVVINSQMTSSHTRSCGCLSRDATRERATKHGMSESRTYVAWENMIQRCYNKRHPSYENYGGRKIEVAREWRESFDAFLRDMGEAAEGDYIDRIDVDGNYQASNCRWVDAKTSARNKRNTRYLTLHGVTKPLVVWHEELSPPDLTYNALSQRIRLGWPPLAALTTQKGGRRPSAPLPTEGVAA